MGWAGLKNGQLLDAAEKAGFDVLVTGEGTLHDEQNLSGRKIAQWVVREAAEKFPARFLGMAHAHSTLDYPILPDEIGP